MALTEAQKEYNKTLRALDRAKANEIAARKKRQEAEADHTKAKVAVMNEKRDERRERSAELRRERLGLVEA